VVVNKKVAGGYDGHEDQSWGKGFHLTTFFMLG